MKTIMQKGPFLSGSKVLVKEMEDGRTLTQTGNTFNGKILNDNGQFRINARMLVSQYVMLEATGYYRNEVTDVNSNSTLTLFAIADVTSRNIVNINLLTHLEYECVIYLVTKKKMTVKKAKRQAQKEIFALLGIDAEGFSNSEALNIAGSSDENGALLAFSIFEQYIRNFWYNEYGLGTCDATREGEVIAATADKYKGTKTRFICKENLWQFATDLEKDTYQWESSTDGALRYGSVNTDAYYVYDSLGIIAEGWRKADVMESQYGGCYFVCDGGQWRAASTQEELFGLPYLARPDTTYNKDSTYACSESNWRLANPYDFRVGARNYFNPDLEYGTLTDACDGRTYKTIQIGNQVWMAENLNYADSSVNGSYYLRGNNRCYNNDSTNCLKAGRFYTWTAAMNIDAKWKSAKTPEGLIQPIHQGICPEGWHVPNTEDWQELLDNIGSDPSVWQAVGFWNGIWIDATNSLGFSTSTTRKKGYKNEKKFMFDSSDACASVCILQKRNGKSACTN